MRMLFGEWRRTVGEWPSVKVASIASGISESGIRKAIRQGRVATRVEMIPSLQRGKPDVRGPLQVRLEDVRAIGTSAHGRWSDAWETRSGSIGRWISVEEAAALTGRSEKTIYRWIKEGSIRVEISTGATVRLAEADVNARVVEVRRSRKNAPDAL